MHDARAALGIVLSATLAGIGMAQTAAPTSRPVRGLLERFDLPDEWEQKFWADPGTQALIAKAKDLKELAKLVPTQAGIHFCRCPNCDASEVEDSWTWTAAKPEVMTCNKCQISVPNDKFPAKETGKDKISEEIVEVLPRVFHHYPYHAVDAEQQRYPDERLYLAAKRDSVARRALAKAALYAAVRHHERPLQGEDRDGTLARLASTLILRFAQVYPAYATHLDQPGEPKIFHRADLGLPYRRGYKTAKWEWTASLDVPLNLVIAYALLRDDPVLDHVGRELGDPQARQTIEGDLFRASAEFVRHQPEQFDEAALEVDRGLLAVGQLLNDPGLIRDAQARLARFCTLGFYHDGFWRQGDATSHLRILSLLDGWIDRFATGVAEPSPRLGDGADAKFSTGLSNLPMLALARDAASAIVTDPRVLEIQKASWPLASGSPIRGSSPRLLGGIGLAHLTVGQGLDALHLQVCGEGSFNEARRFRRQALRLSVGGWPVLGDLDDLPPTSTGWDRATASHNTVVVDGLNQRESPALANVAAAGGDFLFFAADPDFQVACLDDTRAYPQSTTRYRQTLIVVAGRRVRYALGIFEVHGGLQHDQILHAAPGSTACWELAIPTRTGPRSLLPLSIPYIPAAGAEQGRWFVQAYGEFRPQLVGDVTKPTVTMLKPPGGGGVRLHILGDSPIQAITTTSPDPSATSGAGRAALILRRSSVQGATLKSTFVTLYEPIAAAIPPLRRAGRVKSVGGTVVVLVETAEGPQHMIVNLDAGTLKTVQLADGRSVTTDGLVVRVAGEELVLAGGTIAKLGGRQVRQAPVHGRITKAVRQRTATDESRGWFETDVVVPDPTGLAGRTLLIRHGDGTTHGWTLVRAESRAESTRLLVREEPGFTIDSATDQARYYQFPQVAVNGPHHFNISGIARSTAVGWTSTGRAQRDVPTRTQRRKVRP